MLVASKERCYKEALALLFIMFPPDYFSSCSVEGQERYGSVLREDFWEGKGREPSVLGIRVEGEKGMWMARFERE